jgi:uncharacterized protein YkwD
VDGSGALTADEFLLYQWTNMDREMSGQAALFVNPLLQSVAQAHADDMASQDRFGDTDTDGHILNGHDLVYRVGAVGYAWSTLGENVAYNLGFADPAAAFMEQWWNSPPHRANILNPAFTETGLGVARGASGRTYAVQVFARPASPSRVSLLFILAWR